MFIAKFITINSSQDNFIAKKLTKQIKVTFQVLFVHHKMNSQKLFNLLKQNLEKIVSLRNNKLSIINYYTKVFKQECSFLKF